MKFTSVSKVLTMRDFQYHWIEFCKRSISSRTKEALRTKKAQGIKLGRPKGTGKSKLDKFKPEIEALFANGSTQRFIANRYDTTEANLYNWLLKKGLKTKK